ncbi:hypothetical protein ACIG56_32110 [Nocardia fusca]|uniref:hypothetical protein n=1 Tax=Nocardia fusca TaxID=941183 RepID=UPI0037CA8900
MYVPCSVFRRTPLERADQRLSWNRDDQWFFAAGACHILAYAFLEVHPEGWKAVALWPEDGLDPGHIYATDGIWAFDHCGWTPETELLRTSRAAEPHAHYHCRLLSMDLDELCARHWHRTRTEFAHDPWPRAQDYLTRFTDPS